MKGREGYKSGIRPNHWIPGRDYTFKQYRGQTDLTPKIRTLS